MSTSDQNRSGGRRGSAIIDFGEPLPGQDQETGRWGESASFSTTSIALPEVRLDGLGASTLASGSSTIGRADRRPRPPALPQSGMAGDRWPDAGQPTARPPGVPSVVRQSEDADEEAFSDASHEEVGASHPLLGLSPSGPASGSMSRSGSLTGSFGAGGYASSVDGEYTSAPPSRLTSRAATPSPGPAGQYAESAADIETGTESDATTSDYYERPLKGAQGGLGGAKGVASILGLPSGWQKDSSLRNGGWGVASGASPPLTPATVSKARNTKKSWNKMRSQDRDVPLRPFHWSSSSKNRRKTSRGLIAPLRMLSSLLCKLFRTFFGPIHPLTIMIALVLIASFVVSVTMLIIYILNPDKEPLPWRSYCQQQLPFPHPYADALAPVDVFVGVFSVDNAYERRHLIRNTYAAHTLPLDPRTGMPTSNVQVKFVIGRPRKAHARRVALEMEMFNDLVVLDIPENMNQGKTHAFFKWAADNATVPILHPKFEPHAAAATDLSDYAATAGPARVALSGPGEAEHSGQGPASNLTSMKGKPAYEVGWKKADYVVKADDDAFIILDELERHLRVAPRHMTYWGCKFDSAVRHV